MKYQKIHRNSALTRYRRQKIFKYLTLAAIGFVVFFFLSVFVLSIIFSRDLPEPGKVVRQSGYSTEFLDRDGKVIYSLYKDQNRIPIDIKDIPDNLKKATIAIEDKDFFKHQGYSSRGIFRAMLSTIFRGNVQGGSTLTQQLVKNVLLSQERTVTRKIKEFILASEIEKRYSKDQILEMYLNESPYGGTYWGVESAAKGYFDKSAKDLNLVESAILAGLPQRPSYYSPFLGEDRAYIDRTQDVLRRMREDGYITKKVELQALDRLPKIKFSAPREAIRAPHFIFYVREKVAEIYGDKILDSGIKIKTTLSLDVQEEAEKIVKEEIGKLKGLNATNGSVVVIDSKSGDILAMVGSYDYNNEKFGRFNTSTALRQPGSAIKPITYAVAFEKGYTPSTTLMDLETTFPDQGDKEYIPKNYDGKYRGPMQLRFALGNSENVPAVKLLAMIGIRDFLQKASDMGLDTFEPNESNMKRFGLSITLGGGETRLIDLTNAFSVFARGGIKKDYTSILEIKDRRGKTIYKAKKPKETRVLSDGASYLVSHILSDNNARSEVFGTRSYLNVPGRTVAAKTGTTDDKRDNWAVGYTKAVTVGVWVGNNDNSAMSPKIASGATGASPIWYRLMNYLLAEYEDDIPGKPDSVKALEIDAYLGGLPKDGYPKRTEYFMSGTEPKVVSPYYKKLKISKSTGKLANDVEIRAGDYEEKEFVVIEERDPVSTDGKNRWQEAIDRWSQSLSEGKLKPPKETSDAKVDDLIVQIKEPADHARINNNNIILKVRITSTTSIKKVEIFSNGSNIKTYNEDKKDIDEPLNLSDGNYELKVRAENDKGKVSESKIDIGINREWNEGLTPTPTPTPL